MHRANAFDVDNDDEMEEGEHEEKKEPEDSTSSQKAGTHMAGMHVVLECALKELSSCLQESKSHID